MRTFEQFKRQVKQLLEAHNARNPKVFGSVLRGDGSR